MWIQKADGTNEQKLRLRGVTLDWQTYQKLAAYNNTTQNQPIDEKELASSAYEGFKRRVLQFTTFSDKNVNGSTEDDPAEDFLFEYKQLRPMRIGGVHTKHVTKIYRPIVPKGVIIKDFTVVHFGHKQI